MLSYCHLHLSDSSLSSLAGYLDERKIGLINASPLAMGLYSGRELPPWHPAPEPLKAASRDATRWCQERKADIAEIALRYALAEGERIGVATTLVGIKSDADAHRNAEIAALGPLPPGALDVLAAILHPVQGLTWPSGKPENNGKITTHASH